MEKLTYARVCVNSPRVEGVFDYHIPSGMTGQVSPGCLVEVPFGKQLQQGIVLGLSGTSEITETRPIEHLIDVVPVLTPQQLALGTWLEKHSFATIAQCIHQMVFPGLSQQYDVRYELLADANEETYSQIQGRLIRLLKQHGPLRSRQIDRHFARIDWKSAAAKLVHLEVIRGIPELPRPALNPRMIRMAQLAAPLSMDDLETLDLGKVGSDPALRRKAILSALIEDPSPQEVQWLPGYDKSKRLADITWLAEHDLIQIYYQEIFRDPVSRITPDQYSRHELNSAQLEAWKKISDQIDLMRSSRELTPVFLNGITGSGKTELYFRAIEAVIQQGRQVLYLLPEISLTPQTVGRLSYRSPGQVGLVHSRLSEGERYDTWRKARSGQIAIIAGARSAFFTPLKDIGLIVIDESHDPSYYQHDAAPYGNVVDLAAEYARLHRALLIQGTATPDIARFELACREHWITLDLPTRANSRDPDETGLADVCVVDMREELKQGNRSIFSSTLQNELRSTLQKNQQSILYLNRRGTATHIFCRKCGFVLYCSHCSSPLTGHGSESYLKCHFCGRLTNLPSNCPKCGSEAIRAVGAGTEGVELEIKKLLPDARVLRWDADTSVQRGMEEINLAHFKNHQYDILVGTQMISKGLDFPDVTLVGMVLADIGLHLPDYHSPERVFQALTQVAGRAGRGFAPGQVILQTYQPDHYVIRSAAKQDFNDFRQQELEYRRGLCLPPYSHLVRIEIKDYVDEKAMRSADEMKVKLVRWLKAAAAENIDVIGPAPCFFAKVRDQYRWQIILKGQDPLRALYAHKGDLRDLRVEVDPVNLL